MLLEAKNLHVAYGPILAVQGISVGVEAGQIVAVVGANGAGKTTLVRALSGEIAPAKGSITYKGEPLAGIEAFQVARRGVVQCPEGRRTFTGLSVLENLRLGAFGRGRRSEAAAGLDKVFAIFPRLAERQAQLAGTLSGGEQQMLAIGRALMAGPELLLLDEPSLGLAPLLVQAMFDAIRSINQAGTSVLLVEQNAFMALGLADYGYVMRTGTIALEGQGQMLLQNQDTIRAYLG